MTGNNYFGLLCNDLFLEYGFLVLRKSDLSSLDGDRTIETVTENEK